MTTVISVENVSKYYRLGLIGGGTLRADLERWWARQRDKPDPLLKIGKEDHGNQQGDYIWALRDVSFEVQQGEVLGIIGRNGAGKSTLLKILSRVTAPTSGQAKVKGRIASLLEVGTGFHPELTGRENIYLNGAILGMKKAEIDRKFDEIIAFAEVEKFIDTPVKRYSSGMYVRLAFAVAAHLEPEILLVDEVLAVGDATFQKKCLGKMGNVAKEGRTVLFVSHNMIAIQYLCQRAILIADGRILLDGDSSITIRRYLGGTFVSESERRWDDLASAPGDNVVRLRSVQLVSKNGTPISAVRSDQEFGIQIEFATLVSGEEFNASIHLTNEEQINILTSVDNNTEWHEKLRPAGVFRSVCYIPANLLSPGVVTVMVHIKRMRRGTAKIHVRIPEALRIRLEDAGNVQGNVYLQYPGVVRPLLQWYTEYYPDNSASTVPTVPHTLEG